MHRQLNQIIRDSKPPVETTGLPWVGEELKHFWALANHAFGRHEATQRVYDMIAFQLKKDRLHELSRPEFLHILNELRFKAGQDLDAIFQGTPMQPLWTRIRWLQREMRWSDGRLINYILWHGRKAGKNVESIRWLTVDKARAVVIGMQRIKDREGRLYGPV